MAEQCTIKKEFRDDIFKNIERTGEEIKEQMAEFQEIMKKRIDAHVNLAKFEAAYAFNVPKKQREKTMRQLKEVRQEMWSEALKKANGDTKLAYSFYKKACTFP